MRVVGFPQWSGKRWVKVTLKRGHAFVPSFEDLWRIINAICYCEDQKYPYGQGRNMVRQFLERCCDKTVGWEQLREEFSIPDRDEKGRIGEL